MLFFASGLLEFYLDIFHATTIVRISSVIVLYRLSFFATGCLGTYLFYCTLCGLTFTA